MGRVGIATYDRQTEGLERLAIIGNDVKTIGRNINGNPCDPITFAIRTDRQTSGVELKWRDPEDGTIAQGRGIWSNTTIVRKLNGTPQSIDDGDIIVVSSVRNQFAINPFVDVNGTANHVYRAFPMAINGDVETAHVSVFKYHELYGFYIDENDPIDTTCIHYLADNELFTPAAMDHDLGQFNIGSWSSAFFLGRPCMLRTNGTVDYYLDPSNLRKKEDGETDSILAGTSAQQTAYDGNAMQEFPSIFIKNYREGSRIYFYISNTKLDDTYECWNTKRSDGTYADHFYLPLFEGSVISGKLRSLATGAKPTGSTNSTSELAAAIANGNNWYPTLWCDEQVMRILFYLVFGRTQSREALGCCTTNSASSLQLNCGSMMDKGSFWGRRLDNTAPYTGIKFFNMENWWSHRWRRSLGFTTVNNRIMVKMTPSTIDGTTVGYFLTGDSDEYTGNYIDTGKNMPSGSYTFIKNIIGEGLASTMLKTTGGSSTSYMCDPFWSNTGVRGGWFGGACSSSQLCGVGSSRLYDAPSAAYWSLGASLSYHFF